MGLIRREFFAAHMPKRFFQERAMLIQAITFPAKWMKERGRSPDFRLYRRILGTVIYTIKRHGNMAKIERFSVYFLHCVQEHMRHHGDEYYEAAKAARPIASILPDVTREVRPGRAPDRATEILSQMNRILRSPGGRRRRIQASQEADLFSHCNASAGGPRKARKHSQTFAKQAPGPPPFSNLQLGPRCNS